MFAYNSINDQYEEVFEDDELDTDEEKNKKKSWNVEIIPRSRLSSSRSIRSLREKLQFLTRIVSKTGRLNTFLTKLPRKNIKYIRDLGNTLLHSQWRWIIVTLCIINSVCFILFALLLMMIGHLSGDLENDLDGQTKCIVNAKNFASYLLLSVETIMTIGYGTRYPSENCRQVWILHILQALIGIVIQGVLVSAVYVKITKPFTKNPMRMFTRKAVVCLRDSQFCFMFRLNDASGKIVVGTKIHLYFVDKEDIDDDKPFCITEMKIEPFGLLIFPVEIVHVINENSPLWRYSPFELLKSKFEIIAVVEGTSIITGQTSQNKTSYNGSDICWGHRFRKCTEFDDIYRKYVVDYRKINTTIPFDTPLCSAERLEQIKSDNLDTLNYSKVSLISQDLENVFD